MRLIVDTMNILIIIGFGSIREKNGRDLLIFMSFFDIF